jgi:hypothetical protein
MNRFLPLLGTALTLGTAAHAQTVTNTYTSVDPWGNTTTTTIQGQGSAVGIVANQGFYGGYAGYNGGYAGYNTPYAPNYGYAPPAYYPGQTYFVPGYTIPLGRSQYGWDQPPLITGLPQVITTPPIPAYGYGYPTPYPQYRQPFPCPQPYYGYGYGSRTTIGQGGVTFGRGGLNVSIGGTVIRERSR